MRATSKNPRAKGFATQGGAVTTWRQLAPQDFAQACALGTAVWYPTLIKKNSMKTKILLVAGVFAPTLAALESIYEVHRYFEAGDKPAMLAALKNDCSIIVTNGGRGVEAAIMAELPHLKLVACFGVGVDAIDLDYCKAHQVMVSNTPDVLTEDVADLALALLLASVRQVPAGDQFVRTGQWTKGGMALTQTLQGKRVGIVGMGRIGQAIAKRAVGFNTEIAYFGPRKKADVIYQYFDDMIALCNWADIVVGACPGGAQTEKIVSRAALQALGKTGVFVNIARGSIVDQDALVALLVSGELGGAGLDVFNNEPQVPQALWALPHVVLHPHQGSATHETRTAMGQLVLDNIVAYLNMRPLLTPVM